MLTPYYVWTLVALAMATGLVAGVFLAFSDFVMKSLFASQPAAGAEAMQIINREVYSSIFMVLLIGMIPVSAGIAIYGYLYLEAPVSGYLVIAGVLYVFGVFVATAVGNIPMNQRLEAMPQGGAEAQAYWPDYVRGWVRWNHLRWVSALGTSTCYGIAAVLLVQAN
jgi:uncharacterized membrane protein